MGLPGAGRPPGTSRGAEPIMGRRSDDLGRERMAPSATRPSLTRSWSGSRLGLDRNSESQCGIPSVGEAQTRNGGRRSRWDGAMITKFSVLYVGQIDLDNVGRDGTPANERRY